MMKTHFLLFITISLFQSFTTFAQNSIQTLQDSLQKIVKKEEYVGASFALVHADSVIWIGGIGKTIIEGKDFCDENTIFQIGSATKTFTALAILKLAEEGKLNLESKLSELAPEIKFENKWEETHPIRIVHLLEHTTGFDDMRFNVLSDEKKEKLSPLERVNKFKNSLTARWQPASRWSYSNPNYVILGYIIHKLSQKSYEEYVSETILKPLGMTSTFFEHKNEKNYATGHTLHDGKPEAEVVQEFYHPAMGGISTSAADMAKFLRFWLNKGKVDSVQVFKPETLERMLKAESSLSASLTRSYGKGIYALQIPFPDENTIMPMPFYGHNGAVLGFATDFCINFEKKTGFFVVNNTLRSNKLLNRTIAAFLLQPHEREYEKPAVALDKAAVSEYLGFYLGNNPRNEIFDFLGTFALHCSLEIINDSLYIVPLMGENEVLIPVSKNEFRLKNDYYASCYLGKDSENKPVFWYAGENYMEKSSKWLLYPITFSIFYALIAGAVSLIFALIWLVMQLLNKLKASDLLFRITPSVAYFFFLTVLFLLLEYIMTSQKNMTSLGSFNWATAWIFIGTSLFPIMSIFGIFKTIQHWKSTSLWLKIYQILMYTGLMSVSMYLFAHGWLFMMTWLY